MSGKPRRRVGKVPWSPPGSCPGRPRRRKQGARVTSAKDGSCSRASGVVAPRRRPSSARARLFRAQRAYGHVETCQTSCARGISGAARVWTRYGVRMERSAHSSGSTVPAGDTGRTGAHGAEWAAAPRAGPPRAHRFDPGDIEGLASPDPETRASAWERLYTQDYVLTELSGSAAPQDTRRDGGSFEWAGYAVRVARQLEPRFRIRDGAVLRPVGDPEDFAQEAWLRLGVRARKEPLELRSPDVVQGFQAYLAMIVRNVILDARRKLRGQPGAAAQLRGLLARCTTDAERYTLQAAVDLAREGERWDDVAEIARRTGQTHAAVAEIRHALFEYAKGLFREGTKAYWVAKAILDSGLTEDDLKGKGSLDHVKLMDVLDRLGQPWTSQDARARATAHPAHAPGLPEAGKCPQCRAALYQQASRVLRAIRGHADAKALWVRLSQERALAEEAAARDAAAQAADLAAPWETR